MHQAGYFSSTPDVVGYSQILWDVSVCQVPGASLAAPKIKNLPAMQETCVRYLGRENPLEEGLATLSGSLAWKILRGAWWSTVRGDTRVRHDLVTRPQHASS